MIKQGSIVKPIWAVLDLNLDILNEHSASTNPVTHKGLKLNNLGGLVVLIYLACGIILRTCGVLELIFEGLRLERYKK